MTDTIFAFVFMVLAGINAYLVEDYKQENIKLKAQVECLESRQPNAVCEVLAEQVQDKSIEITQRD